MSSLIPVLRWKAGFMRHPAPPPGGFRIESAFDQATKPMARDLILTAGTNDHTTGPHVRGEAIDCSVEGLVPAEVVRLVKLLRQLLGERFTVLYECRTEPADLLLRQMVYLNPDATAPHVHVQTKLGTSYPPPEPVNV